MTKTCAKPLMDPIHEHLKGNTHRNGTHHIPPKLRSQLMPIFKLKIRAIQFKYRHHLTRITHLHKLTAKSQ